MVQKFNIKRTLYYLKKFRITKKKKLIQSPSLWSNKSLPFMYKNTISFIIQEAIYIEAKQLELLRILIKQKFQQKVKIVFFKNNHVRYCTSKPLLTRMGKGIGSITSEKIYIPNNSPLFTLYIEQKYFLDFVSLIKFIQSKLPCKSFIVNNFNKI